MIVNMVAAHYCVPQEEFIDELSWGRLTWYKHTEALEYKTTSFHPTENTAQDNVYAEWTKWAVLMFSIMCSRSVVTYYVTVMMRPRSQV